MYALDTHVTATCRRSERLLWCGSALRSIALGAVFVLALTAPLTVRADTFSCGAGDVPCLIAAIIQANTNGQDGNTIVLDAGTYTLTSVDNNTDGPNGLPSITSRLEIDGAGPDTTFIERGTGPSFRLIHVEATGNLTLSGLTLRGGCACSSPRNGGGVFNHGGSVTITNAVLSGNSAGNPSGMGGSLYNVDGMVTLTDSILTGNYAPTGGGIFNTAGGNVTITRSTLANNTGQATTGGIANSGTVTITDSLIDSNHSFDPGRGGGIQNFGTVTITNSIVSRNGAHNGGGGIENFGTVTITNSTVTGNGGGTGGGIANFSPGTVTITNSTVSGNSGGSSGGGGINNAGGTVMITNSTVSGNNTLGPSGSGGILNRGTVTITNSTVSGNNTLGPSGSGGVLNVNPGTVALENTIVALNSSLGAPDCSGVTSLGNNLIGDTTNCNITLEAGDLTGDPGLDAFTDDGTPGNGNYPLLAGSQAIDAGNDEVCPKTDQLGEKRHHPCDIGAIEVRDRP